MGDADGTCHLVDVLPTRSTGADEGNDFQIFVRNGQSVVFKFWSDIKCRKAGLSLSFCIERTHARQAVRATLAVHVAVDERTAEAIHHFGKPNFTAGKSVHFFHFEAHGVPPVQVHALQHFGPIVGLGAANASLNGDEAVAMVVLLREQTLRLHFVHVRNHLVD